MSEVEETFERIKKRSKFVMIVNHAGVDIRSTMSKNETAKYAKNITQLANKARSLVRDLEPTNDLTFMRIKMKRYELMVAPGKDFFLVVRQDVDEPKNT